MSDAGRAYGWDDEIENPNEGPTFTILPPGEYPFVVKKFTRARHEPGPNGKLPPCNKAIITLEVQGKDDGNMTIEHSLFLHSSCEGFLCQFFVALGLRKHGEPLRMNWNATIGKSGRVKIKHEKGSKNPDAVFMKVDRFLDPGEAEQESEQTAEFTW